MAEITKTKPEDRVPRGGRGRRNKPPGDTPELGIDGQESQELTEKVVFINRSSKVVKGGRRFNFSALVVVGDRRGRVGIALGKASDVADAIRRGGELARNQMVSVSLKDVTIPHEVFCAYGGAKILLRPASPGTVSAFITLGFAASGAAIGPSTSHSRMTPSVSGTPDAASPAGFFACARRARTLFATRPQ